ncbi:hypothetical protein [Alkalibacterium putridalgicola]|uniref:hypothetical protein n=1 Tax=Alkalibacterium putridalgicola TaxID=426703 RepID=UPI000B890364|nr:hypothetical protein [Alkalibacterium putridalgicola]
MNDHWKKRDERVSLAIYLHAQIGKAAGAGSGSSSIDHSKRIRVMLEDKKGVISLILSFSTIIRISPIHYDTMVRDKLESSHFKTEEFI